MEQATSEIGPINFVSMYASAQPPGISDFQEVNKTKASSKRENIEKVAMKILELFPEGINSIMQAPNPKDNEVYLMLIINCTEDFQKAFAHQTLSNSSAFNSKMIELNKIPSNHLHNDQQIPLESLTEEKVEQLIRETKKNKKLIYNAFEELDMSDELLLEILINKLAEASVKRLKSTSEEYYDFCSKICARHRQSGDSKLFLPYYYELHFQDFLYLLCSILKYFTGLFVKLELSGIDSSKVMIILYGDELKFNALAEHFEYDLQLKPYAYKFAKCIDELTSKNSDEVFQMNYEQNAQLIAPPDDKWRNRQFEELDPDDPLHWAPYKAYETTKDEKFRRYDRDDAYHECAMDPEISPGTLPFCDSCSKFRNIDKLRLIYKIVDHLLKFSYLYHHNILSQIVYKRNFKSYNKKISNSELMWKNWNIFNNKAMMQNLSVIRNFFGESIGYYFLWLITYNKWLLFPSVLGIIAEILIHVLPNSILPGFNLNITYVDLSRIIMCVLITFWATLFLKIWKQKEKIFAYFWGMENYERNEPNTESFIHDRKIPFVFGEMLPIMDLGKKYFRMVVSYLVLLLMIIVTVSIVILLFRIKFWMAEEGKLKIEWTIIIAGTNACQIKIMSIIYEFIAAKLNEWENHEKYYQQENSLAMKIILFEFINSYFALYYIAFCKPIFQEPCQDNSCMKEIEYQLYIILLVNFLINFWEVGWPYFRHRWRMIMARRMLTNHKAQDVKLNNTNNTTTILPSRESFPIEAHSVEHQLLCEGYRSLIEEYNERIIQFGYVCMFSIAAPITPFIIFLLTYIEKYVDTFKLFNIQRVDIIEGSTGLEIYNYILNVFYFIGMMTSVGLVLFTSSVPTSTIDFVRKLIIFTILENSLLILIRFLKWNTFPIWFEHLPDLKELYDKKYYNRDSSSLPHVTILEEAERYKDENGHLKKEFIEETLSKMKF